MKIKLLFSQKAREKILISAIREEQRYPSPSSLNLNIKGKMTALTKS